MITKKIFESLPLPWQNPAEWLQFLNICSSHFALHGVEHPLVVELGVYEGKQRAFYEELLKAHYIGIDVDPVQLPTIAGDTRDPKIRERLIGLLGSRKIDILFIDACHEYSTVKSDYYMYSSLVREIGIVAFHDIFNWKFGVGDFWQHLTQEAEGMKDKTFVTINAKEGYANHGIGLVVGGLEWKHPEASLTN